MSTSDWDLGQKLIEQGSCSIDQVREILSLQDRMRKMGAAPKPFARVLLEKGYVRREQLLKAGVKESELPPPVEEKAAAPAPAPASSIPYRPLLAAAVLLAVFAGIVSVFVGPKSKEEPGTPGVALSPEEREAKAREELNNIVAFANASPDFDNAREATRRYESYMTVHAGTQWEIEAHRKLKEYRALLETNAKAELEELLAGDAPLRDTQRWGELLAHYRKYPSKFLETTESGAVVREKLREASQQIAAAYGRDKAEVEKFAEAKKYADALARVKSMEASAPEDRREEIEGLRARIERESRGAAERSRLDVADAYFKIDGRFKQAMLRRDGFQAALAIREFLAAPWKEDQRPFVKVRGVDYEQLLAKIDPWDPEKVVALCESAIPEVDSPDRLGSGEEALLALRNAALMSIVIRDETAQFHAAMSTKEPLNLPGLGKGHFDKKDGKTVFVAEDGTVWDGDSNPMTELDLAALAMMVGPRNAAMDARIGFFYFYSAPERLKEAYEHLARAYTGGARGVKPYLGGLAAAAEGELRRQLEAKFGAAQDLFRSRKGPQAKKLLGEMLRHPEHPYTVSVRPEIEKMLYELAEGGEKEKKLGVRYMAKKVELGEAGSIQVTYDFEGEDQQDAFESVGEEGSRKFKGRWRIDRGAMESSSDASVMRWKPLVKGDIALEYDLTPVDEAQNVVVNLYYNRGRANHYAVVLGFDWIGRQDGDRDNTIEDRYGMPRNCVLKYPVAVDKAHWTSMDAWDGWKTRLAGKPGAPWRPEKGKTARLRIERTGPSIRVLADRQLIWEGQDDEYSEGQLLFYSDRRCRIDNLVITFKPQS
ncbi:MAG TPA: hypothetical protein VNM14_14345 [Planctomycetota bacterium]|nr:hypothetical protein [Planctomycetota bacterium]